jgi:hypothetical protein
MCQVALVSRLITQIHILLIRLIDLIIVLSLISLPFSAGSVDLCNIARPSGSVRRLPRVA